MAKDEKNERARPPDPRSMPGGVIDGESATAEVALGEAVEAHPHVPPYLLGWKTIPRRMPRHHAFGDPAEAVLYAARAYPL